ncbi:MAG: T9SS type A sorting domain-containing protein [Taibaiella sp.]|jgi:hypothetical protein
MKKILSLTSVLLLSVVAAQAQTVVLERSVIAATGSVSAAFDATTGEAVIQTQTNGTTTLTQGFHQNHIIVVELGINEGQMQIASEVYPNPFTEQFWVSVKQAMPGVLQLMVTDINGKVLSEHKSAKALMVKHVFDMRQYASGSYLLGIYKEGQLLQSVKLVKKI